jgi:Haem-NO-binding
MIFSISQTDLNMKGVIFTEFLDLVEQNFGYETVDTILQKSTLSTNGSYSAIGTYPHSEIFQLINNLSEEKNIPIEILLRLFGKHVFSVLMKSFPNHMRHISHTFQLLESIENHIHVEVRKLYSDAELPHFQVTRIDENTIEMIYTSKRKMADLAVGLIEGCLYHFNEKGTVQKANLNDEGSKVQLTIKKI